MAEGRYGPHQERRARSMPEVLLVFLSEKAFLRVRGGDLRVRGRGRLRAVSVWGANGAGRASLGKPAS
jgi:hypothetical protein